VNDPYRQRSPDGFDDDAIFADIVAHMNDVATDVEPATLPPAEDPATDIEAPDQATEDTTEETTAETGAETTEETAAEAEDIPDPQVWRAHAVGEEPEEHFEPPPTTPLPAGDLQFWGIIAGMGGGPLLLLYLVFFNREASGYWILAAIAMSVGGFALLVSRMPGHQEDDDDGARL
jgi:hypothetical protein